MPLLDLYSLWAGAAAAARVQADLQVLYRADILVDGIAASTEFCNIKLTLTQMLKEITQAGDVAKSYKNELYSIHAEGDFYFQAGAALIADALEAKTGGPGTAPLVLSMAADPLVGSLVNIWKGVSTDLPMGAAHGEVLLGRFTTEGAYRCVQAQRLLRAQQTGSSGTGTPVRLGAVSASQGLFAALHVVGSTSTPAGTSFSIISAPSSSLASPTTRVTFNAGTSSLTGEWEEASGAITDPWFAAQWSGFPGTAFTASISAGVE